jgi:hypothetical protein
MKRELRFSLEGRIHFPEKGNPDSDNDRSVSPNDIIVNDEDRPGWDDLERRTNPPDKRLRALRLGIIATIQL